VDFSFTAYFESKVLAKRPYSTREMCIRVVKNPVHIELQTDRERVRFWAQVTVSLYIDLAERAGVDTREVGIDIDQASKHLDLRTLDLRRIPFGVEKVAG